MLFLLYINDIYKFFKEFIFYFFVDDISLIYVNDNLCIFELIVNNEFEKVSEWFNVNKLMFNVKKFNYVIFCFY